MSGAINSKSSAESETTSTKIENKETPSMLTIRKEEEVSDLTEHGLLEIDQIRNCVVTCKIPHNHVDKLLKI
ncbi:hypothetical protein TSAR_003320 [Trichomalopsis sarcophagae]|uniref:Uncharacterized protein n=1 Tax=Trichomalopsis sarcophagae TaxID=543379 RepID=A0A232EEQ9_9HYME|nr:hypothetical protein TSAR_003320 [Trichomalopsis sarcophagae]